MIILSGDNLTYKIQKEDPYTSLHKVKANVQHWADFEILWNGALSFIDVYFFIKNDKIVHIRSQTVNQNHL